MKIDILKVDLLSKYQKKECIEHPSIMERRKLDQIRKLRLTQALRENLKKRKAQVRGRKNPPVEKEI